MRSLALALTALLLAAGCATTPQSSPPSGAGSVVSIHESQQTSTEARVLGSVGGAIAGGLLGSTIGGGSGQTIATVLGSVGGSMAGSAIANRAGAETVWDVTVRFDDGIDRTIRVRERPDFRPGDRVNVSNGVVTRL
jgi:outer membrane lipoprotein SlyB